MFGIGMPELMIIFVIALLVFGPKELPKIARSVGKAMAELRRASDELRDGIQREIDIATREEAENPPAQPDAVPPVPIPEVTSAVPESQPAGAEVHGGATGTPQGDGAAGAPTSQETVTAAVSASNGQSSQPVVAELPEPPGNPVQPASDSAGLDKPLDGTAQASPAEVPSNASPGPETAPNVPVQHAETRNA